MGKQADISNKRTWAHHKLLRLTSPVYQAYLNMEAVTLKLRMRFDMNLEQ